MKHLKMDDEDINYKKRSVDKSKTLSFRTTHPA